MSRGVAAVANLKSERLRIEPLRLAHAQSVWSELQSPEIYTYMPEDPPTAQALERRYAFLEKGQSPDGEELWLNWVAFLLDSITPVGTFQATLPKTGEGSFAYVIFPPHWRQGYAREMVACGLTHLFEAYEQSRLYAEIDTRNLGSIRLVESLGLSRVATTPGADFFKGASSDEYTYALTRAQWQAMSARLAP